MRAYRKLILHADVSGKGGNCQVLDTTTVLSVSSGTKKKPILDYIDYADIRKNTENFQPVDHDYDILREHISLNEFTSNVVTYISGYVVKMMQRTTYCEECLDLLVDYNKVGSHLLLINRRDLGTYFKPSEVVTKVCSRTELFIRRLMYLTNNSLPGQDLIINIITQVTREMINNIDTFFSAHLVHSFNLLKAIIYCYAKIRIHDLGKRYTEQIQGDSIRKTYNKLILFSHQ